MNIYTIVHNGYDVKFGLTTEEMEKYIKENVRQDLSPELTIDEVLPNGTIIRNYQYYTEYCETFFNFGNISLRSKKNGTAATVPAPRGAN